MLAFYKTVLVIAIVLLIFMLVLIGYTVSESAAANWPPIVGDCPDYWIDLSGNGSACYNAKSLGTCNKPTSSNKATKDLSAYNDCDKYTWAKNCSLTWDGITSGVSNPCDTTTTEEV